MKLPIWIGWLGAVISTALIVLWFRDARGILRERRRTLEDAAMQFHVWKKRAEEQGSRETEDIFEISKSIYQQALDLYNTARDVWWLYFPARLLGFGPVTREVN